MSPSSVADEEPGGPHRYTDAETRVMINGELSSPFTVWRGVQQGDPLSCLLFNLAIEPLACALREFKLKGLQIPDTNRRLLVSLFADDTTIYLSSTDSWLELWRSLDLWCTASTAKFNTTKTVVLPFGSAGYRQRLLQTRCLDGTGASYIANNLE
jgi:hypothetical protein